MTLESYIAKVRKGFPIMGGQLSKKKELSEGMVMLDKGNLRAVTAEAYNQDVFGAEVKWADAQAQVEKALAAKPVAKASAHDTRRAVIHPGRSLPQTVTAKHTLEKMLRDEFHSMRRKTRRILAPYVLKKYELPKLAEVFRKGADEDEAKKKVDKSLDDNWKFIADQSWEPLESAAVAGAAAGALQLQLEDEDVIQKINKQAQAWAEKRSAEMVGMRRTDTGRLVQNPNPKWAISDTTRDKLRSAISNLFAKPDANMLDWEKEIEDAGIFDDQRATMIARTESSRAQVLSNLMAWQESEMVSKVSWSLSADHDPALNCNCEDNADEGPYDVDDVPEFPDHPNCMCALVLETLSDEEAE